MPFKHPILPPPTGTHQTLNPCVDETASQIIWCWSISWLGGFFCSTGNKRKVLICRPAADPHPGSLWSSNPLPGCVGDMGEWWTVPVGPSMGKLQYSQLLDYFWGKVAQRGMLFLGSARGDPDFCSHFRVVAQFNSISRLFFFFFLMACSVPHGHWWAHFLCYLF